MLDNLANRSPENYERRRCGLSAGKGLKGPCTARAKYDIYDCRVVNAITSTSDCLYIHERLSNKFSNPYKLKW